MVSSDSQDPCPPFYSHLPALCFCGGWAASTGWHHISLFVSDAFIRWKQSSTPGIYSIAWDIFCQTSNAERQAQCCFSSGEGRKGLNALFSIDLCPTLKIDDIPSDPLNHMKASSLFDQVCGEKLRGYPAPIYGMWCSVGTVPFTCAVRLY